MQVRYQLRHSPVMGSQSIPTASFEVKLTPLRPSGRRSFTHSALAVVAKRRLRERARVVLLQSPQCSQTTHVLDEY